MMALNTVTKSASLTDTTQAYFVTLCSCYHPLIFMNLVFCDCLNKAEFDLHVQGEGHV